jgi:C4-dicarboxylate-binding protein DctP
MLWIATLALIAGLTPGAASAQPATMKIGTATPVGDQNIWMEWFKERVEKRAPGRIDIKLYPSDQLGTSPRQIEGMQLGTVEAWIGPVGFLRGVEPRMQVADSPGLFRDLRHAHRTFSDPELRETYLALPTEKGIVGIGVWVPAAMTVTTRSRPIRTIDDFRGQKIRVLASEIEVESLKRLGGAPTPMPLPEVVPALQQGVVDGVKTSLPIAVALRISAVAKHLTETYEQQVAVVTFVGREWWNKLPGDLRTIMLEEAKKLDEDVFEWALKFHTERREAWLKGGGEIVDFPAAERAKMLAMLAPIGEAVAAKNPEVKKVYDLMVRVSKKH